MTWQEVFLDRDGVRPIWRCLLAVVMIVMGYAAVGIALAMVFGGLGRRPQLLTNLFWVNLLLLPALVGIFRIMTTVFDRKPLGITGLAFHGRARQEVALGLGLGAAMILTVAVLERVFVL